MVCKNCGKELTEGALVCPVCGTDVPAEAVNEQAAKKKAAASNAAPKAPGSKWPASVIVLSIFYLVFYLGYVAFFFLFQRGEHVPDGQILKPFIVPVILAVAVPVLFIIHTKRVAFITALPMVVSLVLNLISFFSAPLEYESRLELIILVAPIGLSVILAILYLIQMIARPYSAALPVLYLIFGILSLIAIVFHNGMNLLNSVLDRNTILMYFCSIVAAFFLTITYMKAMFRARGRR